MRVGLATGFLAGVLSLPLFTMENTSADPLKPDNTSQRILEEKDFDDIQTLRRFPPQDDYRLQETLWAKKTYPTIRQALIDLYQAEAEDIDALRKGKISEKDRQVQICFTSYMKEGEEGEDMSMGRPTVQVAKRHHNKRTNRLTYVIEGWPTTPKGILPPETWRVRVQAFGNKDDLYGSKDDLPKKKDSHKKFITDKFEAVWNRNDDNSKPGASGIYPLVARQHFSAKKTKDSNEYNQTETIIRSPYSCTSCHVISPTNQHAKDSFQAPLINYGAITPDDRFGPPYDKHKGFVEFKTDLNQLVIKGVIEKKHAEDILDAMKYSANFENRYFLQTLKEEKDFPWVEGDTKVTDRDPAREGFTYKVGDVEFERAIFTHYGPFLTGNGAWWNRNHEIQISGR